MNLHLTELLITILPPICSSFALFHTEILLHFEHLCNMHVLSVISVCKTIVESGNKLLSVLHKVPIQTSMDAEVLFLTKVISENRADILLYQNSAEISKKN